MSLLSLANVSFTWDTPQLLDAIGLEIGKGERIGLLGRNGAGKSTLMQILAGELDPDGGVIRRANGVQIARLLQEVPQGTAGSVSDIVAAGWAAGEDEPADTTHEWLVHQAVERILSRMTLDGTVQFATLSSGMKRRVLLAQALVREPDVILLDEPTNHLDIEAILWLERFLKGYAGTLIFVTHDRVFLQSLATRIIEIERGRLFDWTCGYGTFLKRKHAALEAEDKQNDLFDKKLAEEEKWIRQGIKARRTRNEGRVRALQKMREERRQRREKQGNVRMQAAESERSGMLVIEAKNVSFSYGEQPVIRNLSTLITRGDKLGIVGPNGAGKTTLLRILLGELEPAEGTVRHGTRLNSLYFDQLREQIDEEQTVVENVGEGQETLIIDGQPKHIYGYLQDFLFTPERARRPVRFLSGGERNRMLLARLFKSPSNLLVLDEPTNDLDAETMELLEELLLNYTQTVLLVSHDRAFLNNVATGILAIAADGEVHEYDGGYDDYARQLQAAVTPVPKKAERTKPAADAREKQVKLSFKEARELEALPQKIELLETEQADLQQTMVEPDFFKQEGPQIAKLTARLESLHEELSTLYELWDDLDSRA